MQLVYIYNVFLDCREILANVDGTSGRKLAICVRLVSLVSFGMLACSAQLSLYLPKESNSEMAHFPHTPQKTLVLSKEHRDCNSITHFR